MTCGKLPWGDAARSKEKQQAASVKRHMYDHSEEFVHWLIEEINNKQVNYMVYVITPIAISVFVMNLLYL
jgi:hypothetical protein